MNVASYSYTVDRIRSFSMTLQIRNPDFKGIPVFDVET